MSESIRCPIVRIDRVEQHPTVERYNVNYFSDDELGDLQTVSDKKEDGSSRYSPGAFAAFFPHKARLPLPYLKFIGYVDADGKGLLDGPDGNVVKKGNFKSVKSMGILTPMDGAWENNTGWLDVPPEADGTIIGSYIAEVGQDISDLVGITK